MLAIVAIITLSFAACGTAMQKNTGVSETSCIATGTLDTGNGIYDCQTKLRDTRRVNCVVIYHTGIDCDWAHVDGADNL